MKELTLMVIKLYFFWQNSQYLSGGTKHTKPAGLLPRVNRVSGLKNRRVFNIRVYGVPGFGALEGTDVEFSWFKHVDVGVAV